MRPPARLPVVLEPASQAFVEATATPPFLYQLTPDEARKVLDDDEKVRSVHARLVALLVGIGTIPALIGLPLADTLERFQDTVSNVGWTLVLTGVVLIVGQRLATGARSLIDGRVPDPKLGCANCARPGKPSIFDLDESPG